MVCVIASVCEFSGDWLASRWNFGPHQPSGFSGPGIYVFTISNFHLDEGLLPVKQFKGVFQTFICIFQGIVNLMTAMWLGLQSKLLPVSRASPILSLHLYVSWFINQSALGNLKSLGKWKLFNKQQADGGHGGGSVWKTPQGPVWLRCFLSFDPTQSWRGQVWNRKGNALWIERLIITWQ